jgi:acetyl esterase/lipase
MLYIIIGPLSFSQGTEKIYLWPDKIQADDSYTPTVLPDRGDGVIRITDVRNPVLEVFSVPEAQNTGAAVIISPGGAFRHLSLNKEGYEVAAWLNDLGMTAFVLQYSVPDKRELALQDIQRAIKLVRSKADDWGIDPQKIGVIGFSAGGNLCARVSCVPEKKYYEPVDPSDNVSGIPDFIMLIYPGGLGNANERATDLSFGKGTPPMFIFATADDRVANYGSLYLAEELNRAEVAVELHLLPEGGHGYGLRPGNTAGRTWPGLAEKWIYKYIITTKNNL